MAEGIFIRISDGSTVLITPSELASAVYATGLESEGGLEEMAQNFVRLSGEKANSNVLALIDVLTEALTEDHGGVVG